MGKHGLTRLTTAQTWGKPPPSSLYYTLCLATGPTPKCHFVMKFPQLGLSQFWGPITLCANLRLIWHLKQSCSPRRELSNGMFHVTFTQGNRDDSWLLVVESQIANLIFSLSFGHNLCFKCPNESCESILDIYVLRSFQWYKELFNPLGFDPCNYSLRIRESTWTPTPKVGVDLGMWRFIPSHTPTLLEAWDVTLGLPS